MGNTLVLALVWVLGCATAFHVAARRNADRFAAIPIACVPALALLLRVAPAYALRQGASYEMHLFQETGSRLLAGENVILSLPYLPCFVYWMALSDWFSRTVGLDFTFWLKLPSILSDVLMIFVLRWHLSRVGWSDARVSKAVILYALNPVTILVSSYHGQFDTIPSLFLAVSLALLVGDRSKRTPVLAPLSLGVGIFLKTWPGVLALCVLVRRRLRYGIPFLLASAVIPLVGTLTSVLAFGGGISEMLRVGRRALQAGAIPGWWGYTGLINGVRWIVGEEPAAFLGLLRYKLPIVLLPVLLVIWLTRKSDSAGASVLCALITLFVTAPGLGLQSLSWLVPLFLVQGDVRSLSLFVGFSTLHMVISYWGIHFTPNLYHVLSDGVVRGIVQLSSVPVWLYLLSAWLTICRRVTAGSVPSCPAKPSKLT